MNKKKLLFIFGIFGTLNFIFPNKVNSECNFKTGDHIEELQNPSLIKSIDIEIPKSKKYIVNQMKIITSKGNVIPDNLKKNFDANIMVRYPFGNCKYKAKVRQHGDQLDHIKFFKKDKKINLVSSIAVNLKDGNILNSVRFKLLLPETRRNWNEILGSLILKELGFISPDTFEVKVTLNNKKSIMLFQENANRKELLEKNLRREGPIFESDESLITMQDPLNAGLNMKVEEISLSRFTNRKWLLKGQNNMLIGLDSFNKLQKSFIRFGHNFSWDIYGKNTPYRYYIDPNNGSSKIFADYQFMLASMNGLHGLLTHNRKFHFNSIKGLFEPIYYDGNLELTSELGSENMGINSIETFQTIFKNDYKSPYTKIFEDQKLVSSIKSKFKKRVLNYNNSHEEFFYKSIATINSNFLKLSEIIGKSNFSSIGKEVNNNWKEEYFKRVSRNNLKQEHINSINYYGDRIALNLENNQNLEINNNELSKILGSLKFAENRMILLPSESNTFIPKIKKLELVDKDGLDVGIYFSNPLIFYIDEINKEIIFTQKKANDWILIKDGFIDNWKIKFIGSNEVGIDKENFQRQNIHGLTGCLNIYNMEFNNAKIEVSGGGCEDSINIMNSKGNIDSIGVYNAFSDAIDFDFSGIEILNIKVDTAGNDCLDVSGGKYRFKNANLNNCVDKGLSIGEMSDVYVDNILVDNSDIGISIKDMSKLNLEFSSINNSKVCIETKQKKQEFGGAIANINKLYCKANNQIGKFSSLNFTKK